MSERQFQKQKIMLVFARCCDFTPSQPVSQNAAAIESQAIHEAKIFYNFVVTTDLATSHPVALCQLLDLRLGKITC